MTTMRWFRTGGPGRGAPVRRSFAKQKRLALVVVALAGLTLPGCASLGLPTPCGPCGWFGRVFHHKRPADACVPGDVPMGYGAPGAVITPGPVPTSPSTIEQLEPVPSAAPGAEPGARSGSTGAAAGKANYETFRPTDRSGSSRGPNLARAFIPSEPAQSPAQRADRAKPVNPLDDLPPLSIPAQTSRADVSPPVAPEADSLPTAAPGPAAGAVETSVTVPQAQLSPGETSPQPDEAGVVVTPGINRFQGLEPKLAGGSLPTPAGLDWLADKGYKTIIDLRDPGPDQPAYIAEVTKRGLRYLALPIAPLAFDSDHVNRFNAELDQADARPLFFFDSEGDRAGGLWYIRRLTVDKVKVDEKTAKQEAKDLGLSVHSTWLAAITYVDTLAPVKSTSVTGQEAAGGKAASQPNGTPAPPRPAGPESSKPKPSSTAAAPPTPLTEAAPSDPTGWRPIAAMVLTTLGLPLAYWGRSVVSLGFLPKRASLPGAAPSRRSLPGASDA